MVTVPPLLCEKSEKTILLRSHHIIQDLMVCALFLTINGRAGLSNEHYGHGSRGPCALGAQERGRKKIVVS